MKSSSESVKVVSAELSAGPLYTFPEPFLRSIAEKQKEETNMNHLLFTINRKVK